MAAGSARQGGGRWAGPLPQLRPLHRRILQDDPPRGIHPAQCKDVLGKIDTEVTISTISPPEPMSAAQNAILAFAGFIRTFRLAAGEFPFIRLGENMKVYPMIKKLIDSRGLVLSVPMAVMIWITFVSQSTNLTDYQDKVWSFAWLVLFALTLPWSIPITIMGFVAVFATNTWWGGPLLVFTLICAMIAAHINSMMMLDAFGISGSE